MLIFLACYEYKSYLCECIFYLEGKYRVYKLIKINAYG